jgi:hypothetical protein
MKDVVEKERSVIAASTYQSIKHVIDILNQHEYVKGKFVIHYPVVIQVDEYVYVTSKFEDQQLTTFLNEAG